MEKVLVGPYGAKLFLDKSQAFHDDPDAGTPAIVKYRSKTATYWCAIDDGECDGLRLPNSVLRWLRSKKVQDAVRSIFR